MKLQSLVAVLLVAATVSPVMAGACPSMLGPIGDEQTQRRVAELERLLSRERRNLEAYRIGWASGFAIAALGQVAAAELVGEPRGVAIYVSAIKATVGAAFTPFLAPTLELPAPAPGESRCARLAALEEALRYAARRERQGVVLYQHALGWALNLAGLLYLGLVEDQWLEGIAGALVGSAVGELRLWTQPRRAIEAVETARKERGPWLTAAPFGLGAQITVRF